MLSKTDFVKHEECPIWLWLVKLHPELLPEITPGLRRIFDSGDMIDQLARKLYPEGLEIEEHFRDGWANTQIAIANGETVLIQPVAVTSDGLSSKADFLTKDPETGLWDLREVKSSASVKDEHLVDVAFQRICFEKARIRIGKTYLIHLNNQYVRAGEIDIEQLFVTEDITASVSELMDHVRKQIEAAKKIISYSNAFDILLVEKCHNPEKCDHLAHYLHGFPEIYNSLDQLSDEHLKSLLQRGLLDYIQVSPENLDRAGFVPPVPFREIDKSGIRQALETFQYPLYFFDYGTYNPALPPFDGLRPYQQVSFQYSLHIQREKNGPVEHAEFLETSFINPMPNLLKKLKKDIGPTGSILVWNDSFEKSRNKEMAEMYPEYAEYLTDINNRMFDLMDLFRFNKNLYLHSDFKKSHSLKKILPVICPELSYDSLEIREGGTASASWPILTSTDISPDEKQKLEKDMLLYCQRDTEALVAILKHLQSILLV